ncbi:hypothetical protein STRTUCAR8_02875 [Streptomyces turgidiscabies Car8]|uniref:Uncharacterized protein n=1 Tax=Streptomyces turgidiscabies (strain Car8) TaxID=698760 RepID=L7EZ16_STRT8|nr:hypothetical protein STRTUCAR8_02875 [Streptomyces turgidiscabies Car8]
MFSPGPGRSRPVPTDLGQPCKSAISPDFTPCSCVTPSLRRRVRPCSPADRPRRPYDNLCCANTRSCPIFTDWPTVILPRRTDPGGPHAAFPAPPLLTRNPRRRL